MVEFSQLMYGLATTGARRRSCLRTMTEYLVRNDRVGCPQQRLRQAADKLRAFAWQRKEILNSRYGKM